VVNYNSEDEQIEALKRWWADNRGGVISGVVLAVAITVGWQGWQSHTEKQLRGASDRYQVLIDMMMGESGQPTSMAAVAAEASDLKAAYPKSAYAGFAALHLARIAVERSDLDGAEAELRWILTSKSEPDLKQVAEIRLARVLAAKGEYTAALKILERLPAQPYGVVSAMARGDILLMQGDRERGQDAYRQALDRLLESDDGRQVELAERLRDLAEGKVLLAVQAAVTAAEPEVE